ncbi:MAG: DUF3291 domain-containing protein [Verrucomicrobiales bacterium]|nr:DUF3291 domain-containing protein [Verrucomicrobiales bacterium]
MNDYHVAQVNVAKMKAPLDSPIMADFVDALDEVNALADRSPGFVWRFQTASGNAVEFRAYEDPLVLFNLSVWQSIDALKDYTYKSLHGRFFARRQEWFTKMNEAHMALWWIPAGSVPEVAEAKARLEHLRRRGAFPYSFTFQDIYKPEAQKLVLHLP